MNRALIILSLIAGSSLGQPAPQFLVDGGHVGTLSVGMLVDDLLNKYPEGLVKLVDQQNEGFFTPVWEIHTLSASDQPDLVADVGMGERHQWIVTAITINNPAFRTAKGLGVGSKYSDLLAAYPNGELNEGGEAQVVWWVQSIRVSFFLDVAAKAEIKGSTKIRQMLVPEPTPTPQPKRRAPKPAYKR